MTFTVIIPARYGSTRLPGKPLLDILGKPMIQHVYERAGKSKAERVVVATDDDRVASAVNSFGGEVLMTNPDHPSGTDRIEEVARALRLNDKDLVVNVQGDEPLIPAAAIDQVAANLTAEFTAGIATLCEPVASIEDFLNPNIVKVVRDDNGMALYFSRAPIPWDRDGFAHGAAVGAVPTAARRHLGIYAYRVSLLRKFVTWSPTDLENGEALEQLRALANGARIHVADALAPVPPGVDTHEDLQVVRALMGEEAQRQN